MPGRKGMGGARPGKGTVTEEGVGFGRPSDLTIRMEVCRCLDHNPKLAGVLSIPSYRTRGVPTKRDALSTRQPPSTPNIERTGVSSGDSVARQRAPVGDPSNDE